MRFLDLFAGIGGFRLGMESAGHECVGFVEIDKYARQSYQAIHQTEGEWTANDITTVEKHDIESIGHVDIICGGFPCQAFSVAGQRRGFEDTRGTLFFDVARFASILRPKLLFLENVKGLLNHDKGETFRVILSSLESLGYDVEWQLLNSKDFGVPQNRERVFIIGHLRGERVREVFPIRRYDTETNDSGQKRISDIRVESGLIHSRGFETRKDGISHCIKGAEGGSSKNFLLVEYDRKNGVGEPLDVAHTLNSSDWRGLNRNQKQNAVVYNSDARGGITQSDTVGTLRANSHGNHPMIEVRPVLTPDRMEKRQNGRRFKDDGEEMFTLTGQDRHGVAIGENQQYRIRKLTPRECWRLQGFPDWAFDKAKESGVSDSQLYKQAGNSVTVNVISEIAKRLT
ncbi:DNA cytosine methyltransferase [Alicyclobacillus tolerans]|uniref:Cytosine-specific methyltransferase n=1 Tax=Alicyclobacillus tolerans TaxID=90970 RepID=A0A1M6YPA9_9BACL|nr:DNA cytosine methyltransferase [Alicyclobacillus montanus]SHL19933.1 DNA (cytosine-5)-methyltransferase 1 [Alicyclobacillus montanus]